MTLAEAVETIKRYCDEVKCNNCHFGYWEPQVGIYLCKLLGDAPRRWEIPTETNIYDEEEIHENCTVQILRNSVTGEESIGWWENE